MPKILYSNNAYSTLAGSLTNVATTLTVQTGHGDRFPTVTGTDIAYLTLEDNSGNREIVKVTARAAAADSMTIVRAQEGTTARAWNSGDVVEQRITAGELARYEMLSNVEDSASKTTPVDADMIPLKDSAASNILKYLTWANLKAGIFTAWGALTTAGTSKATPVDADSMAICDSAASDATKKLTWASLKAGIFTAWGALTTAGTSKATPVDADSMAICDSAASDATKKLTWANLKTTLFGSGLSVSGGAFSSRGITDNATATVMTLASSNEQTQIANATNGITNKYNGRASDNLGGHYFYNNDGTTNQLKFTWSASETRWDNLNGVTTWYMNGSEKARIATDGTTMLGGSSSAPAFKVIPAASQVNYISAYAAATAGEPLLLTTGTDTNVTFRISSQGAGNLNFYTNAANNLQVSVAHTASANRYITLTGSNGGNPTIGTSGGGLAISPNSGTTAFISSGSTSSIAVQDTGVNGGNIRITGDGATTPAKTIRVISGQLQVVNSAYSAVIFELTDAGDLSRVASVKATGTGGIGYGTGAGGTVTQATSLQTGVTLNKPTGKITTYSSGEVNTYVEFTVTNSTVGANDCVVVGTSSSSFSSPVFVDVSVNKVSAGSFDIRVENRTASSLSNVSWDINFTVIKGVTS